MSQVYSNAVEQLIRKQMASGRYASEDELLVDALESLEDDSDLRAIEEALAAVDAGEEGVPYETVFARLRKKYGYKAAE